MSELSPDRHITIAGQQYTLVGSFRTLKAIQHVSGNRDILLVLADALQFLLRFDQLAELIHIGIEGSGTIPPEVSVIEQAILDDIGINDAAGIVMEWLMASCSPKREREGNVTRLRQALEAEKSARLAAAPKKQRSPGGSTAKSA